MNRHRSLAYVLSLALGAALLLPSLAVAQNPADSIAAIRQQILYARYDDAIGAAQQLIGRTNLTAAQRNEALEVLATAHLANRDNAGAEPILQSLYSRDPGYAIQDPDASPLVQGAFQRARAEAPTPVLVQIDHTPPAPSVRQSPLIELQVTAGADAISELQVHYRLAGAPRFAVALMDMGSGYIAQARLPLLGAGDAAQTIEYYIVANSPSRTVLASVGGAGAPLSLEVPAAGESRSAPIPVDPSEEPEEVSEGGRSSKWWVALIVVGVAGAAIGGYFLFRGESPSGTLGHVTLR